ncbi:MAG: hypothetical protein MAG431_01591 [Chloroflexi bacterium]|nr:hypothetical protein [Chloroflexota bacterium]
MFKKLFSRKSTPVIVVSGLPRSGTSMMMKMLEAAGIPPLTDEIREADDDNPKGYYEFERVKKLPEGDVAWLPDAQGKSVKVIAALLKHLPDGYIYKVIFMNRAMEEILASQKKMLENRQEDSKVSDEKMAALFEKHKQSTKAWMEEQSNLAYVEVSYNTLLENPISELHKVNKLLGGGLEVEKMAAVVDPELYRQRVKNNE